MFREWDVRDVLGRSEPVSAPAGRAARVERLTPRCTCDGGFIAEIYTNQTTACSRVRPSPRRRQCEPHRLILTRPLEKTILIRSKSSPRDLRARRPDQDRQQPGAQSSIVPAVAAGAGDTLVAAGPEPGRGRRPCRTRANRGRGTHKLIARRSALAGYGTPSLPRAPGTRLAADQAPITP